MRIALRGGVFVVWALALVFSSACGGSEFGGIPTNPSPIIPPLPPPTPAPTPTIAPPPAGVSPAVWRVAFIRNPNNPTDGRLYRPDAVHIILPPDIDEAVRVVFSSVVGQILEVIENKTPIDLTEGLIGANFPVSVVPGFACGEFSAGTVAACTGFTTSSSGKVIAGKMEFSSKEAMLNVSLVMHEILWTLGMNSYPPVPGIMSANPAGYTRPTEEERRMLLGRYNYPLLSVYAPQ